jgi:hypothetical protein
MLTPAEEFAQDQGMNIRTPRRAILTEASEFLVQPRLRGIFHNAMPAEALLRMVGGRNLARR